jgi:hypothetical protein
MRPIAIIVSPILLAAACNTSTTGDEHQLEFTPVNCGNALLGCDLAAGLVAGGEVDVEVRGLGGVSTDGLTLTSTTPSVAEVTAVAGAQVPTWSVRGLAPGVVDLSALDSGGLEVDTVHFTVGAAERLSLVKLAGTATGPDDEAGADEAWQVTAGALVSFQAVPMKADYRLIGRLPYTFTASAGTTLLETEQSTSDRPKGYLYVQPAAGDYTFTFALTATPAVGVDVALHAR